MVQNLIKISKSLGLVLFLALFCPLLFSADQKTEVLSEEPVAAEKTDAAHDNNNREPAAISEALATDQTEELVLSDEATKELIEYIEE